ncbi:hypothetical protein LJ707_09095 [Mucilaginibacter sp. UR6-1]|uniref:hypothetical protein n=1 Tax=Mucilaginibacter sp. UR6-1 TaxID=1435643 RepID=UPI001E305909|nr:hypothetical protein [Mucilaginibacter sp. UR6-1]MCC8409085.1 hypothetical protein [Mucilaginibacter sp. UR6-1]
MYREKTGDRKRASAIPLEYINRKVFRSHERTRKNFVRRVFAVNPLFALQEIQERYAGYDEQ